MERRPQDKSNWVHMFNEMVASGLPGQPMLMKRTLLVGGSKRNDTMIDQAFLRARIVVDSEIQLTVVL